jgi:ABC-type multidrug transport system ATPase subunit
MLKVIGLHRRFGDKAILAGVSFACRASEIVVVAGSNGAGKSTLLRIVAGLIEASAGDVIVGGHRMHTHAVEAKALMGYVPDGLDSLPDLLVSELIALVRSLKASPGQHLAPLEEGVSERLGVTAYWDQRLGSLSFGERKRVALLAALCGSPPLLVLDEPSSGLDAGGVELVRHIITERSAGGRATVLATNDRAFAESLAARRYLLERGKLVASDDQRVTSTV